MNTFDTNYDMEIKEFIFTEHNKNKFIDGKMFYRPGKYYKYNII